MTERESDLLDPVLGILPVGLIIVDPDNRVSKWNQLAERFIATVNRPTLYVGMTLEETHPGPHGNTMRAVVERLKGGKDVPPKTIDITGGSFRVHYRALFSDTGDFLGIAQVIEFLEEHGEA